MLKHTFCHIRGVGKYHERELWEAGIRTWDDAYKKGLPQSIAHLEKDFFYTLDSSCDNLEKKNVRYFGKRLPPQEIWRLFPDFRDSIAFLDIETTGLSPEHAVITTIAVYDGNTISTYVHGKNLSDFPDEVAKFKLFVSFNGIAFDIPFINSYFGTSLSQTHIDLRYILKSLGYAGGLKKIERDLGMSRDELDGVDGLFAVRLWYEYSNKEDEKALETLLAYNIADTVNLEHLMVFSYNRKLMNTPFYSDSKLPDPERPEITFQANKGVLKRLL
jgi:uncharacterized protein